jgi:hypothetical protein
VLVLKQHAPAQLEVRAKIELHSWNATEHSDDGELLKYDAEAQRWAVELIEGWQHQSAHTEPGVVEQGRLSAERRQRPGRQELGWTRRALDESMR